MLILYNFCGDRKTDTRKEGMSMEFSELDYDLVMPLITEFGMPDWVLFETMKAIRKLERLNEEWDGYPFQYLTDFLESMIPVFAKLNRDSKRTEVDDDILEREKFRHLFLSEMDDRESIEKLLMRKLELPEKYN